MKKYKIYWETCKKREKNIAVGVVLLFINTIIAIRLPFAMNNAIDALFKIEEGINSNFLCLFVVYIILFLLQSIIDYATTILFKKIGNNNSKELGLQIINKVINAEKQTRPQVKVGDSMVTLTGDIFQLGETGILLIYRIMYLFINVGALFYYMWSVNYTLAILITCVFLLLMLVQKRMNKKIGKIIEAGKAANSEYMYVTNGIVKEHEEYRKNGSFNYIACKFNLKISELLKQRLNMSKMGSLSQLISVSGIIINMSIVFLLGAYFVYKGQLSLSGLITFNMFSNSFGGYLTQIPSVFIEKKSFDVSCERVDKMMNIKGYADYENNNVDSKNIESIKLSNIDFAYEEIQANIISNVSMEFEKDKIYCISGSNGSGKSTLLNIIYGDYKPKTGCIYINNCAVDTHEAKNWIDTFMTIFSSSAVLYNDNIMNNIILGDETLKDKLDYVLRIVNFEEWISSLDKGIFTEINELKENLSDGQKQKIALARYLLKTKNVLLIDEVEKHLDFNTKVQLIQYFKSIKKDRIIIIASHDNYVKENSDIVMSI